MEILNYPRVFGKVMLLSLFSLILSCSSEEFEPEPFESLNLTTAVSPGQNSRLIKDQYIILLSEKPAREDKRAEASLEALTREVRGMNGASLKGYYNRTLTGFAARLNEKQVKKLKNDSRVLSVTQDRYIELEEYEEMSVVSLQEYPTWGLDRMDQREKILDRAYTYTASGKGVNVYIIDSGIRYSHEEFQGRASLGVDLVKLYPDEVYDEDDPELEPGNDCGGHGTHVAATVGGEKYGVSKEANLISVRVFSCVGITSESRVIQAVDWITDNAVKPAVVNMSLGGTAYDLLDLAVENSVSEGIHYVTSAGNAADDACNYSPARTPGAISVGATNISNERAYFSNFGNCLDVYAPGFEITSASHLDDVSSTIKSGTSMAAPHVAGLAALFLQNYPEINPAELKEEIKNNATADVIEHVPSGPNLLAYSHWEPVDFTAPNAPDLALEGDLFKNRGAYRVELKWEPIFASDVSIYRDEELIATYNHGVNATTDFLGKIQNATIVYKVCETLYKNCSEKLIVIGNGGQPTESENYPPTADFSFSNSLLNVEFTDLSSDIDGSIISWNWDFGDGNSSSLQHPDHTYSQGGTYDVMLVVTDDLGDSHSITKKISVSEEITHPEAIQLTAIGSKVKGKWQSELSWTPSGGDVKIAVYRNGNLITTTSNSGSYIDNTSMKGSGSLEYKICESGTENCSNSVTVVF